MRGGGHHRIEVTCGLAKHQIPPTIRLPSFDESEVGFERALHHMGAAVELAHLLTLGYDSSCAGRSKECRNAGAASTNSFSQRALRI